MAKTFAVIGDPIDHSLSPNIHSAAFRHMNMMDCSYIAYRIPRDELEEGIKSLQKINIAGFNVTIPHKVNIMQHIQKTDETCSAVGAANTVQCCFEDGTLKGYNTDVDGFADPLHERSINLQDSKVLLLGAGGAAKAIVAALARESISHITIANRTIHQATVLANNARSLGILHADAVNLYDADVHAKRCNVIINATSIGLPSNTQKIIPINAESINEKDIIYDIVYLPMKTDLIKKGKQRNATCVMGYEMLLGQAVRSFEIWHGIKAPRDVMRRALLGGV